MQRFKEPFTTGPSKYPHVFVKIKCSNSKTLLANSGQATSVTGIRIVGVDVSDGSAHRNRIEVQVTQKVAELLKLPGSDRQHQGGTGTEESGTCTFDRASWSITR